MAKPDEVYREFVRRSHRLLATYLSVHAWVHDLDCIILERQEILRFWGLTKRVERERKNWLRDDVKPYFPHVTVLANSKSGAFHTFCLSRRKLPAQPFFKAMYSNARAKALTELEVNTAVVAIPRESVMLSTLARSIHGLADFPKTSVA